ncbi:MAG: zinc-binding dehydrogenase, partial [Lentisphaerae bacterium]|nr:zinc-binding dehydrogenase [Lentisphaerota bacterium]
MTARALIFAGTDRPLELRAVPLPALGAGEILVRITMSTLCGSDLHTLTGKRSTPLPTILGHEIVGVIEAAGPGGPGRAATGAALRLGQRVTWSVAAPQVEDFFTTHGMPQKAGALFKYGHERLTSARPLSGGFASHCVLVPGTAVVPLPDGLADAVACPANCAVATSAGALRLAGVGTGAAVVIQGAGMLGLQACAQAAAAGAAAVVAVDLRPERLDLARQFGATHVLRADEDPGRLAELARNLTDGRGADAVLEFTGQAGPTETALDSLRIGGRLILVGAVFPGPPLRLDPERIIRRLLRIEGLHNYTPDDLVRAVDFLDREKGRFPFERLVEARYALDDYESALRHALDQAPFRV